MRILDCYCHLTPPLPGAAAAAGCVLLPVLHLLVLQCRGLLPPPAAVPRRAAAATAAAVGFAWSPVVRLLVEQHSSFPLAPVVVAMVVAVSSAIPLVLSLIL